MRRWSFFLLILFIFSPAQATDWEKYPKKLPTFDFEGDKLQQNWGDLTAISQVEYPDTDWLKSMVERYPRLAYTMVTLAAQKNVHPAIFAAIHDSNFDPLAYEIQQVWRLHFEGKFKEAYKHGMQLGPLGEIPAIYSRLSHATLLISDHDEKIEEFEESAHQSNEGLTIVPDYSFAQFGLVYARVRTLELMDTGEARSSGYIGFSQEQLGKLQQRFADRAIYFATQGGLEAGIVERIGSFLGSITYGATKNSSIEAFDSALKLNANVPVIYNEYAVALARLNKKKFRNDIKKLLQTCIELTPISAEEALNQMHCQHMLDQDKKDD